MTAEQLADWICDIADCVMCETIHNAKCRYHLHKEGKSCYQCWLDWLNSVVGWVFAWFCILCFFVILSPFLIVEYIIEKFAE